MKALVLDDDHFCIRLVNAILERHNIEYENFMLAKSALDFLNKGGHVDVIIADITMPQMDGYTFLRHLKSNRRLSRIPVIMCSGLQSEASIVQSIEAGATAYIVKPVKEEILIPKVKKAIELYMGSILVVDDVALMCNLLVRVLNRECYNVLAASTAAEALEMIRANKTSLVITDVAMPDTDGFELLAKIKERHPHLPVFLMSGRGEFDRSRAIAAGAEGFIRKPFHNVEILSLVQSYVH